MKDPDYTAATYGDAIASRYDAWFSTIEPGMVARLSGLAADGAALELGIGTGRVALRLRERGVDLDGLEASTAMLDELRKKPGGSEIPVRVGTFADFEVERPYDLVFLVFNTFFMLTEQSAQVACFRSVSRALAPAGKFLIEAFVPDPGRFDRGQTVRTVDVASGRVRIECSLHDASQQTVTSQIVELDGEGAARFHPIRLRYAWPAEIDLMAELAGLRLVERAGGWHGEPFTADSTRHITIYEKPPSRP
jgi:SAM-dependent methyltransferase